MLDDTYRKAEHFRNNYIIIIITGSNIMEGV